MILTAASVAILASLIWAFTTRAPFPRRTDPRPQRDQTRAAGLTLSGFIEAEEIESAPEMGGA
jgi:hypothetical protein